MLWWMNVVFAWPMHLAYKVIEFFKAIKRLATHERKAGSGSGGNQDA